MRVPVVARWERMPGTQLCPRRTKLEPGTDPAFWGGWGVAAAAPVAALSLDSVDSGLLGRLWRPSVAPSAWSLGE
jgi:hypothetical protein